MPHDHDDSHASGSHLDPMAARVMALETILTEKGLVDPAALDALVELYEHQIGPRNGARVVARAWSDPAFADWLRRDATAAIASLGYSGRQGEHMRAVFNTPGEHNLIVCTLCSCYPIPVLGLPPVWYKAPPYRSRAVIDPRGRARRVRADARSGHGDPGLGFDGRAALPGGADAPRGQRGAGRGGARRSRHPRLDDRHRAAARAGDAP